MSKLHQVSFLLITLVMIKAYAQGPSHLAKASAPAPASNSLAVIPPEKDEILKKLWLFYGDDFATNMLQMFKARQMNHPRIEVMDDPKILQKVKSYYYMRFAKLYSDSMSLEELKYLNQLNATSLIKRVNNADSKIWAGSKTYLEELFDEAKKNQPLIPTQPSIPAPRK